MTRRVDPAEQVMELRRQLTECQREKVAAIEGRQR